MIYLDNNKPANALIKKFAVEKTKHQTEMEIEKPNIKKWKGEKVKVKEKLPCGEFSKK